MSWEMTGIRIIFLLVIIVASFQLHPFGLSKSLAALLGASLGVFFIFFEMRLERASLKRLIGAAAGSIFGILGALMISHLLSITALDKVSLSFLQVTLLLLMAYVGLVLGANKGDLLNLSALGGLFSAEVKPKRNFKILDTSVIIDGRIADITETGFVEGTLIVPKFILEELQYIADSSDDLRRTRGRRGLDILKRLQQQNHLRVEFSEDDIPNAAGADSKLVGLALKLHAKILTNDFNLHKVAELQGLEVLNINQLANAMKPAVLPGESMQVQILREGKSQGQGVAYLDDGTMVVIENARRYIGKEVEVSVTSVLQTTAGRMIFSEIKNSGPGRKA